MVLLTVTPTIIAAVKESRALSAHHKPENGLGFLSDPSFEDLTLGGPIPHNQIIAISRFLRSRHAKAPPSSNEATVGDDAPVACHLNDLLRSSWIYVPPPKPKPEPTPEYKALMARLRAEEERKAYERLINPPTDVNAYSHGFSGTRNPFAAPKRAYVADEDDEMTFADVDRQITLILNIVVSVIACAAGIWVIARYWDTPTRLFISMGGGLLVGVAEVVIYAGYIRRVKEAKVKERKIVEKKEILDTWVIESHKKETEKHTGMEVLGEDVREVRNRKGKK